MKPEIEHAIYNRLAIGQKPGAVVLFINQTWPELPITIEDIHNLVAAPEHADRLNKTRKSLGYTEISLKIHKRHERSGRALDMRLDMIERDHTLASTAELAALHRQTREDLVADEKNKQMMMFADILLSDNAASPTLESKVVPPSVMPDFEPSNIYETMSEEQRQSIKDRLFSKPKS